MLTQIAHHLFADREENIWDSSTLFRGETSGSGAAGSATQASPSPEPLPILLAPPITKSDHGELTLAFPAPAHDLHAGALPHLSWTEAARDAADGVHYVREAFPSENMTYLSTPFRREPIAVAPHDRVLVLEELSEHALRVRRLADGAVGVVPAWNVEEALERLARLNMEFNEIVTTPAPQTRHTAFARTLASPTTPALYYSPGSPEVTSDDDLPSTPTTPAALPRKLPGSRKVEFAPTLQKTVFRYPQPDHESVSPDAEDWWWDGWEEREGAVDGEQEAASSDDERMGRPRLRRKEPYIA